VAPLQFSESEIGTVRRTNAKKSAAAASRGPAGAWRPSGWRGARRLSESVLAEEVFPGRRALRPKFSDSLQPPGYVEEARRTRLIAREAARTSLGQKRAVARPQFSESEIGRKLDEREPPDAEHPNPRRLIPQHVPQGPLSRPGSHKKRRPALEGRGRVAVRPPSRRGSRAGDHLTGDARTDRVVSDADRDSRLDAGRLRCH
jgi:hypothetical protein